MSTFHNCKSNKSRILYIKLSTEISVASKVVSWQRGVLAWTMSAVLCNFRVPPEVKTSAFQWLSRRSSLFIENHVLCSKRLSGCLRALLTCIKGLESLATDVESIPGFCQSCFVTCQILPQSLCVGYCSFYIGRNLLRIFITILTT